MTFPRPGETPWTTPYPQPLPAAPYAVQRPKAVYPGDTQGAVEPYLPPPASAGNEARQPVAPQASAGTEPPPENPTPATHSQEGVAAEAQPLPDNSTHEPDKSTEDATGGKTEVALGSTAMSQSETAPPSDAIQAADSPEPAPSPGRRAVETIREQWRSGIIKSGQINPVIAERYAAIRSKLQETATTWLANNPAEGRRDTEIAKRFANAWLLHSLKSDNPEQYMRHYAMMREALAVYVADVAEIRDMGFGSSAEANAMYVSPAEIEQCFELKSTSRHLTDAAIHRAAENRPRDPVGSVRDYIAKANMLEETFGTRLDDATIRHFASRQAVTTCRNRVEDYLSNVDLLMERYRGHELVTPYLIRSVSRDSENPGLIIENRLAAAEELIGSYEGRAGLTKTMIFQAINNHAEPTKRLDGYIQTIDAVREAFIDYLPDGVIRSLALGPRPIATGRALIAKVESLRAAFHDDPLVQESDLLYFARNNKETGDALQMLVYEYRQNIAAADEYYLGDERMNMELIRRASLQLDGNVIDVLESKLAIMDRLQEQFSDDDVPKWVYRRMVAQESDPEGALRAYLQQKDELIEQFGHVFSPGVIGIAQSSHRDVSTRLAERAPLVTGWWNRYGKLQLVPLSAIQWAAALSSDPETRLAELHGQGLLRAMRDLGRSAPSGGGYQPGYALKQQVGTYEAALAAWAAESAEQNPSRTVNLDDAKRYFSRSLLRYVKASGQQGMYGPDPATKAAWEKYWNDVVQLEAVDIKRPAAIAAYNDAAGIITYILGRENKEYDLALADYRVSDPVSRIEEYYRQVEELKEAFKDNALATPSLIKHAAQGYPANPRAALEDQLQKLVALRRTFADNPAVTEEVYTFLSHNFYVNPENEVRKYLERRQILQELFPDDPDMDETALVHIPLDANSSDRDRLQRYGEIYKERLHRLRLRAAGSDFIVDDEILKAASARRGPGLESRYQWAIRKQQMRNGDRVNITNPVADKSHRVRQKHEHLVETRDGMALPSTEDVVIASIEAPQHVQALKELLTDVTPTERVLLLTKIGGASFGLTDDELRQELGTHDLDGYLARLLERLRRRAGTA